MSDTPTPDLAAEIKSERRLEERYRVHWPILLSWTTPAGPAVAHGRTVNLSLSGIHLAAEHNFAVGQQVAWRLSVHPWHGNSAMFEIEGSAKIAHSAYSSHEDGFDVGLQFQDFAADGKARLAKVIEALQQGVSAAGAKVIHGIHPR